MAWQRRRKHSAKCSGRNNTIKLWKPGPKAGRRASSWALYLKNPTAFLRQFLRTSMRNRSVSTVRNSSKKISNVRLPSAPSSPTPFSARKSTTLSKTADPIPRTISVCRIQGSLTSRPAASAVCSPLWSVLDGAASLWGARSLTSSMSGGGCPNKKSDFYFFLDRKLGGVHNAKNKGYYI